MPYYQATKSQNFEFGLTALPYLVTHPSGPLGLVGVFMGDLWGFSTRSSLHVHSRLLRWRLGTRWYHMGGRNIGYVVIGHCWQVSLAGASCGAANKLLGRNNTKLSSTQVNNPKEEVHSVNKGGLSKKDSKSGIKNYRNCGGSHAAEQKSCLVFGKKCLQFNHFNAISLTVLIGWWGCLKALLRSLGSMQMRMLPFFFFAATFCETPSVGSDMGEIAPILTILSISPLLWGVFCAVVWSQGLHWHQASFCKQQVHCQDGLEKGLCTFPSIAAFDNVKFQVMQHQLSMNLELHTAQGI